MESLFAQLKEQQSANPNSSINGNFSRIESDFLRAYPVLTSVYLAVLAVMMVVGTAGNVLVIGAVLVSRRLRTTGNIFILNLALADLFLTAFIDPFSIVGVVKGPLFFVDKVALCLAIAGFCLPSCLCSLWSMGAIAINRYIFLCHNHHYNRIYTRRKTVLICLCLWIVGYMSMEFPARVGWIQHTFDMKKMMCSYDRLRNYPHIVFFVSVGIGLPLVIVSGFYLQIFMYVLRTKNQLQALAHKDRTETGVKEKTSQVHSTYMDRVMTLRKRDAISLAKTLFLVFIVFFLCWTPYAVVILVDRDDSWSRVVYVVAIQMGHSNASINSIIYASSNRQFRRAYLQFLTMCCPKHVKSYLQYSIARTKSVVSRDSLTDSSFRGYRAKELRVVYNITYRDDDSCNDKPVVSYT